MNFIPDSINRLSHFHFAVPALQREAKVSTLLMDVAHKNPEDVYLLLGSGKEGLNEEEVKKRLEKYGHNEVAKEKQRSFLARLWENLANPLVILLIVLGLISYLTGDTNGAIIILCMVFMGVALRYFQEQRADDAAEKLREMVHTTATVVRDGTAREIILQELVPGDVIHLSVGDMVPADVRLITARDLFINQSALTGESMPV
jgi:P-type Mg2+ transporter